MNRQSSALCLFALCGSLGVWFQTGPPRVLPFSPAFVSGPKTVDKKPPANSLGVSPVAVDWSNSVRFAAAASGSARSSPFSLPLSFEPNVGQADERVQFIARGKGLTALLLADQILLRERNATLGIRFETAGPESVREVRRTNEPLGELAWTGEQRLRGTTNYLIGSDRRNWRTNVPHFSSVRAADASKGIGVKVYGNERGLEYDLQLAPGIDVAKVRLAITSASDLHLNALGDLVMRLGDDEVKMRRPVAYQVSRRRHSIRRRHSRASRARRSTTRRSRKRPRSATRRKRVPAAYVVEPDGSVGFRLGPYDPRDPLIIDPSLSVTYATFLGGTGTQTAAGIAVDSSGKMYVGGTTTSASTFPEAGARIGPVDGPSEFFIAKIDPTVSGANSLLYLTFLGGSGNQNGGLIAVDASGDVAITGTTTSVDFPVTDTTQPTNGLTSGYGNDAIVSEINPAGSAFVFSTIFGGSGTESQGSAGGIALDSAGDVYIASVTATTTVDPGSPDLPVTANAFQTTWDGDSTDGYLAIFEPPVQSGGAATLKYCSYLDTNSSGALTVGGVAVDESGNAYIAGSTADSALGFPSKNAFQSAYGGGTADAFLMKISPLGQGTQDLVYASLLGGSGTDQALAVAVDSSTTAPNAYVTGLTQSSNFPVNGTIAPYQSSLHPSGQPNQSNAFLTVVAQNPISGQTSLAYSSYLGGSFVDAGQSIAVAAPNSVYIAGGATSYDFPWRDNLQPFNGAGVAFVAKLDPTSAGVASLLYATPLGGTSPVGGSASAFASAVAADGAGHVYTAGTTTSGDFPTAVTTQGVVDGFQPVCLSCTPINPSSAAFVTEIVETASQLPSVAFTLPRVVFTTASGNAPQFAAVLNLGEAQLSISDISIVGPNAADFSLLGASSCIGTAIQPGLATQCSFEVAFAPTGTGPEAASISVTDDAPGSPQALELSGAGGDGPELVISPPTLGFGNQPENTESQTQFVTLSNVGDQPLTFSNVLWGGNNPGQFNGQAPCASSTDYVLAPQQSCVFQIVFQPNGQGPFQAQIEFFDNSGNVPGTEQVVTVTGTGVAPAPVAKIDPLSQSLAFGTETVGSTTPAQAVTLTNTGSAALTLTSVGLTGINAADFAIPSSGTTCPTGGGTLVIGASCTVAVQFAPQSAGSKNASLTFSDNAAGNPQQVSLSATATAAPAPLNASPGSLAFGSQSMSTTSASQTITISNASGTAAGLGTISVTDSEFSWTSSCPPSIAAGANCQVGVTFTPNPATPAGPRSATLTINGANPSSIALSGVATQSAISVPPSVNFASQLAGAAGTSVPITITNTSSGAYAGPLTILSVQTSGTNAADFLISSDACAAASTSPGNSCTISVQFKPQQASPCGANGGARSATLSLTDNAPGSPQSIALAGTAMDFCPSTAPGQGISEPEPAGQTQTFNLEIQSSAGFSGAVALACSGAPPLGACSVSTSPATSPVTVQVSATTPGQFELVVTSTAPSTTSGISSRHEPWRRGPSPDERRQLEFLILFSTLLLSLLALRTVERRRGSRLANSMRALSLLLAFACLSCCGKGGDPPTLNLGTPSGTYNVTITATVTVGQISVTRTMIVPVIIQNPDD